MKGIKRLLALFSAFVLAATEFSGAGLSVSAAEDTEEIVLSEEEGEACEEAVYADEDIVQDTEDITVDEEIVESDEDADYEEDSESADEESSDEDAEFLWPSKLDPLKVTENLTFGTRDILNPVVPKNQYDNWHGSYVLFGDYSSIIFRVLDKETTDFNKSSDTTPTMLLHCDDTLVGEDFGESNTWEDSGAREFLNHKFLYNFVSTGFTDKERDAIKASYKSARDNSDGDNSKDSKFSKLDGDKVFILDEAEARRPSYGFVNNVSDTGTRICEYKWWLRSPVKGGKDACVDAYGSISSEDSDEFCYVCPALNIDLSKVLFSCSEDKGEVDAIYKLTLGTDDLKIEWPSSDTTVGVYENQVEFKYNAYGHIRINSSASRNINAISLLITDKEYDPNKANANDAKILYYNNKKFNSERLYIYASSEKFTLPKQFNPERWGIDYKVYMLVEVVDHGGCDYASWPVEITREKVRVYDSVTVKFDNGGHGDTPATQKIRRGGKATAPYTPYAEGYKFLGWYTSTGVQFSFISTVDHNITLYAKWGKDPCKVYFDMYGGGGPVPETQTISYGYCASKPKDPEREGYVFVGWRKGSTGNGVKPYNFATPVTTDFTLFAIWKKYCEVTFDANGGTGTMEPAIVLEGEYYSLPDCEFDAPADSYFNGWMVLPAGVYLRNPGSKIKISADTTIKASWEKIDYKIVTFKNKYGEDNTVKVIRGETVTEPSPAPTRENYTFLGWYTYNADDNKANDAYKYDFNSPVKADLTLYACWRNNNKYQVTAKEANYAPGGTITVDKDYVEIYETITLTVTPEEGFELDYVGGVPYYDESRKEVYRDWNFSSDNFNNGTCEITIPDMEKSSNKTISIYACFKACHEHDFEYINGKPIDCYTHGTYDSAICKICGHEYRWNKEDNSIGQDITRNPDSGKFRYGFHGYDKGEEFIEEKAPTCTEPGNIMCLHCLDCDKYSTSDNWPEELTYEEILIPIDPDAHEWDEDSITYTWSEDNSEVTAECACKFNSEHIIKETVATTLTYTKKPTCAADGVASYTTNAFSNPIFTVQTRTGIKVPALGHDYEEPVYTWSEDFSECTAIIVCNHDESHNVTEKVASDSWNMADHTTYSAVFEGELFEKQTIDVACVTFDMNGVTATNAPDSQYLETGKAPAEPVIAPSAEGYKFAGWFGDEGCRKAFDFNTPVRKNTVVYAKWTQVDTNLFTVTFDLNGKSGTAPTSQTVEKGAVAVMPVIPKAEGYVFTDWYKDKYGTSKYDFATPVTADITIFAGWEEGESVPMEEGEVWNLFENASAHEFKLSTATVNGTVINKNSKSAAYYDAKLSGDTIVVRLKGKRKKAADSANSLLKFDLGDDGTVEYALPVSYVKPSFKLDPSSVTIKGGAVSTVSTKLMYKAPGDVYEPYDMTDVKVSGFDGIRVGEDGSIEFETSSAVKGKISVEKAGWDPDNPVKLSFNVKTTTKKLIDVGSGDTTVIVNSNAREQTFTFDLKVDGEIPSEGDIKITDKKNTGLATMATPDRLEIAYPEGGVKAGAYTITLESGGAKTSIKVKVSDKALDSSIKAKVQSKLDVVTGQSMIVIPNLKDVGGVIEDVELEGESGFSARLNQSGNIVIDYDGKAYNAKNLKLADIVLKVKVSGISSWINVKLSGASAKKTTPKIKTVTLMTPGGAGTEGSEAKNVVSLVSTYKLSNGEVCTIEPSSVRIVNAKNVFAYVNHYDNTKIIIARQSPKSGSVKVLVTYPGGVQKTVTIKVKALKKAKKLSKN